jgi:hypothetical protein
MAINNIRQEQGRFLIVFCIFFLKTSYGPTLDDHKENHLIGGLKYVL